MVFILQGQDWLLKYRQDVVEFTIFRILIMNAYSSRANTRFAPTPCNTTMKQGIGANLVFARHAAQRDTTTTRLSHLHAAAAPATERNGLHRGAAIACGVAGRVKGRLATAAPLHHRHPVDAMTRVHAALA